MKVPSVVNYYINKIKDLRTHEYLRVCKFLEQSNFKRLGSGCEAIAYSRKGFEYVIKVVYSNHTGNSPELLRNNPNPKHFVEGYSFEMSHTNNYYIVIQKKVEDPQNISYYNRQYKKLKDIIERNYPSVADVCEFNCGYINGRLVCFDWTDSNLA